MELSAENGPIQAIQLNQSMESVNNEEEVRKVTFSFNILFLPYVLYLYRKVLFFCQVIE